MSFIILVVLYALDATFFHLGIAANVCVGETATLDEEYLHAKQDNGNRHKNYGQK